MFRGRIICFASVLFFRGFGFSEHTPRVNLNEGSNNSNLTTHGFSGRARVLDKAQLGELGWGQTNDSHGPVCGLFRDTHSNTLLNSAVPASCVVSVPQTVTQIM